MEQKVEKHANKVLRKLLLGILRKCVTILAAPVALTQSLRTKYWRETSLQYTKEMWQRQRFKDQVTV